MFEIGSYYFNRRGDVVQVTKFSDEKQELAYCEVIFESINSHKSQKGVTYNFWTKSGSWNDSSVTSKQLEEDEIYQNIFDVLPKKINLDDYPEYFI